MYGLEERRDGDALVAAGEGVGGVDIAVAGEAESGDTYIYVYLVEEVPNDSAAAGGLSKKLKGSSHLSSQSLL